MAFIHAKFKLKRVNFGSWHCLTKWALDNKLINQTWWSWYKFSQKLPHTLIPVIASIYCGTYAVPFFFSGPPCVMALTLILYLCWLASCSPVTVCSGHPVAEVARPRGRRLPHGSRPLADLVDVGLTRWLLVLDVDTFRLRLDPHAPGLLAHLAGLPQVVHLLT